jgi:hypothetical protein
MKWGCAGNGKGFSKEFERTFFPKKVLSIGFFDRGQEP